MKNYNRSHMLQKYSYLAQYAQRKSQPSKSRWRRLKNSKLCSRTVGKGYGEKSNSQSSTCMIYGCRRKSCKKSSALKTYSTKINPFKSSNILRHAIDGRKINKTRVKTLQKSFKRPNLRPLK